MPTDCNKPTLTFTSLGRRCVSGRFDAGAISSDGGVLLLRQVDRRIKLLDRVDQVNCDPRNPFLVEHQQRTLLAQRVLAIACGWEDLNDHGTLRNDLVFQLASNRKPAGRKPGQGDVDPDRPLASASTLCRLENRVDRNACVQINKLLVELFIESHKTPPQELILDFDATDDPVHGQQEGQRHQRRTPSVWPLLKPSVREPIKNGLLMKMNNSDRCTNGIPVEKIAGILQRQVSAIHSRLEKLPFAAGDL